MAWEKRTRKYREGDSIVTMSRALHEVESGRYIMVKGKPVHPSIIMNWTIPTLRKFVNSGRVARAELTNAYAWMDNSAAGGDPEFEEVEIGHIAHHKDAIA